MGTGVSATARQISPSTSTCPSGASGSMAMALQPTIASAPIRALRRRARTASRTRKTVIPPKPALTAKATHGRDAHLRHRRGHQRERSKGQAHNAGNRQHAVAAELGFKQQQNQRRHQQQHGGIADGQQIQRKNRQQHHQRAQRAGNDGSRRIEFEIDQQRAATRNSSAMLGSTSQPSSSSRSEGCNHFNARPGQVQRQLCSVHARNLAAVERGQQLRVVVRNQVDQVLVQRLLGGVGVRGVHGLLRRIGVAVAPRHIRAQKCLGVVLHLLAHGGVGLAAELKHRMRRAGVRAGSHGGHVRRLQQKESRRAGARPRRRHIDNHRNPRAQNRASHGPRRIHQSARRVHLHQQRLRAVAVGAGNGPDQFGLRHRLNGVVEHEFVHKWTGTALAAAQQTRIPSPLPQPNPQPRPIACCKPLVIRVEAWLAPSGPAPRALLSMACLGLNLPQPAPGRLAGGLQLQSRGGIVAGLAQIVGRKIEPAQHKVRIRAGFQFQGLMRLHPRAIRIAAALAHLGQPGVSLSAVAVGGHSRLVKPLRLQQQPAVQKSLACAESFCACSSGGSAASRAASTWSSICAAWRNAAASKLRTMRSSGSGAASASGPASGCRRSLRQPV